MLALAAVAAAIAMNQRRSGTESPTRADAAIQIEPEIAAGPTVELDQAVVTDRADEGSRSNPIRNPPVAGISLIPEAGSSSGKVAELSTATIDATKTRRQADPAMGKVDSFRVGDSPSPHPHPEVGRPFPLSDSVLAGCKLRNYCVGEAIPVLSEFADEERNPEWAAQIEAEIGNYVAQRASEGYALRVTECRTTLCAAEVVSQRSEVFYLHREPESLHKRISLDIIIGFPEILPTYQENVVTLLIFQRR
jgi:hypothetical protein